MSYNAAFNVSSSALAAINVAVTVQYPRSKFQSSVDCDEARSKLRTYLTTLSTIDMAVDLQYPRRAFNSDEEWLLKRDALRMHLINLARVNSIKLVKE
jgi:hypothetical protein